MCVCSVVMRAALDCISMCIGESRLLKHFGYWISQQICRQGTYVSKKPHLVKHVYLFPNQHNANNVVYTKTQACVKVPGRTQT